ncbi:MAG: TonB-dependent receptor [Bacteroidales bacterium]|nr:TonB-dependent receptor [Bacteroidales bacterium]
MCKRFIAILSALLVCAVSFAQGYTGGVKGTVVNRAGRIPVSGATLTLVKGGEQIASTTSDAEGKFLVENLEDGVYAMTVMAPGFTDINVNVTVDKGFVKDLIFVSMVETQTIENLDDSSFAEFDMDDSGYTDNPTILFGQNDVYTNIAGYGFSSVRFKNRGYNSESQDVLLAGVNMNDAITGYSPFSLWSGLNEAMRSTETSMGNETADFGVGGFNGQTNIQAVPSSVRKGWRFSLLTNSALYRFRAMVTYASGELDNGWSYAFNASARLGGNDWVEGVYYRSFAYYLGVEKKFGNSHRLSLVSFATPGQRGAQNASTQEVYDLMGDNMYNSNWGYQNGKVRNSRVRKTFEPVTLLKYTGNPLENLEVNATVLWRTGFNGYTALDWYDAQDPRPDYYRNLPSYSFNDDEDYGRLDDVKYEISKEMWNPAIKDYANYQHLNWDRMYNVNYNSIGGRSKYALEERHVDQNDFNVATSVKWRQSDLFTLTAGINARINRTENYKKMNDLLGGEYFVNVDQFAERDFASNESVIQNDLDYFLNNGHAQNITKGQKYGYDYLAQVRKVNAWGIISLTKGGFSAIGAGTIGYTGYWREGLVRKGLFAGTYDEVAALNEKYNLTGTSRELKSNGETSFGRSETAKFLTGSLKGQLSYVFVGGHRLSANLGLYKDAPSFTNSFVSPRTRNTLVGNLKTQKTISADINYQLSTSWMNLRLTGFLTQIYDQTDVMSFYDDSQQSMTNFAMTGIAQRHMGIELGVKVPLPVDGLSVAGVLSFGEYIYTKNFKGKNPYMVQTVDNSAEVIRKEEIPYWVSHPSFRTVVMDGETMYDVDNDGNPYVKGQNKHYVPSTPQLAAEIALNYRTKSYWFFELNTQFFARSYLDMNPLYRTHVACAGPDGIETPAEIAYMASQESLFLPGKSHVKDHFLLNASIGKSWYIQRKYSIGFSLNANNLTNNRGFKTGGYEQTRLIKSSSYDRYYRFDPKYFYMQGASYMLNVYFRF